MSKTPGEKPYFIFDTHGDWYATLLGGFIYGSRGDYLGFVEGDEVYKRDGEWIGKLSKDGRILRKRSERRRDLHPNPPRSAPKPERLPPRAPLPPMMAELNYSVIDVLDEDPEIFKRISDLRPDMD
ncbi:hypothetical protein [Aggregatilinea lenta]|uniref:hypothetical protein n=1 Tax=Aggregatilinea lenta TaxID=913108 RepID=UPI000E5B1DAC|nr:hypothetical protein [Aggregatilinea lenta]